MLEFDKLYALANIAKHVITITDHVMCTFGGCTGQPSLAASAQVHEDSADISDDNNDEDNLDSVGPININASLGLCIELGFGQMDIDEDRFFH
jgi:hypothetical protein